MRSLILLALVMATCQSSGSGPAGPTVDHTAALQEGVMLTTDRQSYSRNQQVRLTLRNEADHAMGFNLCMSTLERRQGGQWVAVPPDPNEVCTSLLAMIAPGQSSDYTFTLGSRVTAGEYRYRTEIEQMGDGTRRPYASNTFQVSG